MDENIPERAAVRIPLFDGLRGVAIVLVVLSHGWALWPTSYIDSHNWTGPIFRSGDSAVTIFLATSGFLFLRAISSTSNLPHMHPTAAVARRILRVGPTMWAMLVTVMVIAAIDSADPEPKQTNHQSFGHALTFTYNWLIQENLPGTRTDWGHLWYLSVDMQAVAVIAVIAYFLRNRPTALLVTLASLFVALVVWRFHAYATENIWIVINRTTVRMDPFVLGALAAVAIPRLPNRPELWRSLGTASLLLLLPTLYWCHLDGGYLRWGGTALELLVATVLVSTTLAPPTRPSRVLATRPLVFLGAWSLSLYIWHFPIFYFTRRHTLDWDWPWKVIVALLATAAIVWASRALIERPVSRALRYPEWSGVRERGPLPYLWRRVKGLARRNPHPREPSSVA